MTILVGMVGLFIGMCIGGFLVFYDSTSQVRTKLLFDHVPHLPYFANFYMILLCIVVALKYPLVVVLIISGMVGVESAMFVCGTKLRKSIDN